MSKKNPSSSGAGSGAGPLNPGGTPKALLCEEWEALLVDALDGKLSAKEAAAFEAHRESCLACAQLLEESKRGSEWLHFLEAEPEVPADLVGRILAQTSGAADLIPAPAAAFGSAIGMPVAVPAGGAWTSGWLPMMERHATQSRWIMTAAMAFFSIAFTLNLTGVKLTGFRLADLRPTTIANSMKKQFYVGEKSVSRYYDGLTFFYELESRVREMRQGNEPAPTPNPSKQSNETKPAAKHTGGNAERKQVAPNPAPEQMGEPVMAKFEKKTSRPGETCSRQQAIEVQTNDRIHQEWNDERKSMRAERSLA
jgi:hypothetical protein